VIIRAKYSSKSFSVKGTAARMIKNHSKER
jgi:hypothetical protein